MSTPEDRAREVLHQLRIWKPGAAFDKATDIIATAIRQAMAEVIQPAAEALESAHTVMVFDARDWSQGSKDAWLYGLFVGWDTDECYADILQRHPRWKPDGIARLKRLRAGIVAIYDSDREPSKDASQ